MVCAIIGIMTTAVLVSMRGNKNEKAVETSAREVAAAIREAQNYALTGKGADGTCTNYNFHCTQGNANYEIIGCVTANYTLKNDVRFRSDANSECETGASEAFYFSLPHGTVTGIVSGKIILEKGSDRYTVCINAQGSVWEKQGDSC